MHARIRARSAEQLATPTFSMRPKVFLTCESSVGSKLLSRPSPEQDGQRGCWGWKWAQRKIKGRRHAVQMWRVRQSQPMHVKVLARPADAPEWAMGRRLAMKRPLILGAASLGRLGQQSGVRAWQGPHHPPRNLNMRDFFSLASVASWRAPPVAGQAVTVTEAHILTLQHGDRQSLQRDDTENREQSFS